MLLPSSLLVGSWSRPSVTYATEGAAAGSAGDDSSSGDLVAAVGDSPVAVAASNVSGDVPRNVPGKVPDRPPLQVGMVDGGRSVLL